MSSCSQGKQRLVFIGSIALNIFLIAFVLGRLSVFGFAPPPPPPPPPPFGGHGIHGEMPSSPPMVGMSALLSRDEMRDQMKGMRENFSKIRDVRKGFADKLKAGPVTKEQALAHFAQIDSMMDGMRKQSQVKMAEKISSLSEEDRLRFADKLDRPSRKDHRHDFRKDHGKGHGRDADDDKDDLPPPPPEDAPEDRP